MKQARTSVLVALALICVVSCAKIDDESSAVASAYRALADAQL